MTRSGQSVRPTFPDGGVALSDSDVALEPKGNQVDFRISAHTKSGEHLGEQDMDQFGNPIGGWQVRI